MALNVAERVEGVVTSTVLELHHKHVGLETQRHALAAVALGPCRLPLQGFSQHHRLVAAGFPAGLQAVLRRWQQVCGQPRQYGRWLHQSQPQE